MDIFRLELYCPDIKTQVDVEQVMEVLGHSPGFSKAEVDLATHRVVVTTADQDRGEEVIRRLARAGFPPNNNVSVTSADCEGTFGKDA